MTPFIQDFANLVFDYIVLGGGTAGLAVAARLSEDPQVNVGVIEAGTVRPGQRRWGDYCAQPVWRKSRIRLRLEICDSSPAGIERSVIAMAPGAHLGGTSALDSMAWNRGHREDYDAWEELGNAGWGWGGLLCV